MKCEPVFLYLSMCHGLQATKPACATVPKAAKSKKRAGSERTPEYASLGSWSCGECGKPCKVTRVNRPVKEAPVVDTQNNRIT